jgi:hypothetical protein
MSRYLHPLVVEPLSAKSIFTAITFWSSRRIPSEKGFLMGYDIRYGVHPSPDATEVFGTHKFGRRPTTDYGADSEYESGILKADSMRWAHFR